MLSKFKGFLARWQPCPLTHLPNDSPSELVRYFPDSIQLNRNSTGYTWSIKIRSNHDEHNQVLSEIERIDDNLKKKYRKDSPE